MEDKKTPTIKLYGTSSCHKTQYYKQFFDNKKLPYLFFDIIQNKDYAEDLRGLYENRCLNFPTIVIEQKKLRNPSNNDIEKCLNKLM